MQHVVIKPLPPEPPEIPAAPRPKRDGTALKWWGQFSVGVLGFLIALWLCLPIVLSGNQFIGDLRVLLGILGLGLLPAALILVGLSVVHAISLLVRARGPQFSGPRIVAAIMLACANFSLAARMAMYVYLLLRNR